MIAIKLLWMVSNLCFRTVRLVGRALRDLAVVLWREA